jgi:putative adhesin
MRKPVLALSLVLLALAAPAVRATFDETEHINQTVKLDPGGTLRLRSFSGRVTITGSDRPEVVIDAVRRGTRSRLDRIKLDIHTDGSNVVVVDANRRERSWFDFWGNDNVVATDFDIKVPARTSLDVSVFSAPVTIEGVEGSHRLHGFSSRLTLSSVGGPIQAHTFSGSVVIREASWEPNQTIDVDTFSGNVEVQLPDTARGSVRFNSFSGNLNSEMPLTLQSSSRRSVRAELGGGGNSSLRVKTFSGSVKVSKLDR